MRRLSTSRSIHRLGPATLLALPRQSAPFLRPQPLYPPFLHLLPQPTGVVVTVPRSRPRCSYICPGACANIGLVDQLYGFSTSESGDGIETWSWERGLAAV